MYNGAIKQAGENLQENIHISLFQHEIEQLITALTNHPHGLTGFTPQVESSLTGGPKAG